MKNNLRFILKIGCILLMLIELPFIIPYCIFVYPFTKMNFYHYKFILLPFGWLGKLNRQEKNYFYKLTIVR